MKLILNVQFLVIITEYIHYFNVIMLIYSPSSFVTRDKRIACMGIKELG